MELKRTKKRILGGVFGGIAKKYELDLNITRIFGTALVITISFFFLLYILAWIFLPLED